MKRERWGAAAGIGAFVLGGAAASLERGAPAIGAPAQDVARFFSAYRGELLAQSFLFVLSAGAWLWFLGSLRSYLLRWEGGAGTLSTVAFGTGVIGIGIQALIQAPQSALAMASRDPVEPSVAAVMANMGYAFNVIAYIPLAVMLGAVTVLSVRTSAFPMWMASLSAGAAVAFVVMSAGIAVDSGPLAAGAWPTFIPYVAIAVWLLSASILLLKRTAGETAAIAPTRRWSSSKGATQHRNVTSLERRPR
jgi:hypothetical protein